MTGLVMYSEQRTGNEFSSASSSIKGSSEAPDGSAAGARSEVSGGLSRSEMEKVMRILQGDRVPIGDECTHVELSAWRSCSLLSPEVPLQGHLVISRLVHDLPCPVGVELLKPFRKLPTLGRCCILLVNQLFLELGRESGIRCKTFQRQMQLWLRGTAEISSWTHSHRLRSEYPSRRKPWYG